jgi:transcriptional repressor NF-X1
MHGSRVGPGEGDGLGHGHGIGEEPGGLHECELICEKMLSCGNHHRCEEMDHRGGCPPQLP